MLTAQCDDCKKPIDPADNHLEIAQLAIIEDRKIAQAHGLHFCTKQCLDSWFVKNANRPRLVTPKP